MDYTLNEEQIKFLVSMMGGMTDYKIKRLIMISSEKEDEVRDVLRFVERNHHLRLYAELEDLISK